MNWIQKRAHQDLVGRLSESVDGIGTTLGDAMTKSYIAGGLAALEWVAKMRPDMDLDGMQSAWNLAFSDPEQPTTEHKR